MKLVILVALSLTVALHHEATSLPAAHFTTICCPCIDLVLPSTSDDRDARGVRLIPDDDVALKKTDAIASLGLLISCHIAQPCPVCTNLPGRPAAASRDAGCLSVSDRQILNCSLLI